ncbi:MAG TPA: hypothetical protein VFQ73_04910 [Flavisolibacter sp.]|nr:hypothetical protein [Flavisolibacter sp.]
MKGSSTQPNRQNNDRPRTTRDNSNRAQNKDNLDSREGEEQDVKGDDVTHNRKEKKTGHLKDRGKDPSGTR